ncbi:p-type ATPase [Stemphylium lycopersici]|uniref:p-type ATPase n=1 Tax=Stemphylium lycopersici TaxID=183478 RepID=A0A364MV63_STELY|nr:hypothetical protein TW65_90361 [Stemphylium lycopersici]RAR00838.1 p-type ATPase [Stemphylium lycopersici]RAR04614.1 p-type ATPase [Stemphylium lycopersici]
MKLLAIITLLSTLAAAAPVIEVRAVTTTIKSSSAMVTKTSSAAVVAKSSSSSVVVKSSSVASVVKSSSAAVVAKSSSAMVSINSSSAAPASKTSSAVTTTTTTAPLLGVNVGGSSSPLLGVKLSSSTLLAVDLGGGASSTKASTITAAPTSSTSGAPPALPSTFSAPVQGQGVLSLNNLPAMPGVIDKTFSGVLGAAYGLMSGACDSSYRCNITVAGSITNLLVDGQNYTTKSSMVAWCEGGRCYGTADVPLTATAPFIITCDQLSGTQACSATISGAANAIFTNGQSLELWGWLTPSGYCQNGVCTASITAVGDPMY